MARVIKPPAELDLAPGERSVFLAGSIEMGRAEDWQSAVTARLRHLPAAILNPRREAWDSSWVQSIDNPLFREQVEWELEALERCTAIAMYFAPGTQSPVSLLELGLFARSGKIVVCCPDGFWRKGNVEIVCQEYGIPLSGDLDSLIAAILKRLG